MIASQSTFHTKNETTRKTVKIFSIGRLQLWVRHTLVHRDIGLSAGPQLLQLSTKREILDVLQVYWIEME